MRHLDSEGSGNHWVINRILVVTRLGEVQRWIGPLDLTQFVSRLSTQGRSELDPGVEGR